MRVALVLLSLLEGSIASEGLTEITCTVYAGSTDPCSQNFCKATDDYEVAWTSGIHVVKKLADLTAFESCDYTGSQDVDVGPSGVQAYPPVGGDLMDAMPTPGTYYFASLESECNNGHKFSVTYECPSPSAPPAASGVQDPHFRLAHGGRADFRGRHGVLYNLLSSSNVSVNVRTENASFALDHLTVDGSFMTEAHVVMLTSEGRFFNISFWASELNRWGWGWGMVNGSCAQGTRLVPFTLSPHRERACDDLRIRVDFSSAIVEAPEWHIQVRGMPVYDRYTGPHHRVDLSLTQRVADDAFVVRPHGIVGQSFDGDGLARTGRLDAYPPRTHNATFVTSAMAEGAIDGTAADYEVPHIFSTDFSYSRFGAAATPRVAGHPNASTQLRNTRATEELNRPASP